MDKSTFKEENDAVLEAFVRSVIRGRLAGYHLHPRYVCHGPKDDETVPSAENLCDKPIVLLTYVRGYAIAFCEQHLPILINYLWHPIQKASSTDIQNDDHSLLEKYFLKYQEEK